MDNFFPQAADLQAFLRPSVVLFWPFLCPLCYWLPLDLSAYFILTACFICYEYFLEPLRTLLKPETILELFPKSFCPCFRRILPVCFCVSQMESKHSIHSVNLFTSVTLLPCSIEMGVVTHCWLVIPPSPKFFCIRYTAQYKNLSAESLRVYPLCCMMESGFTPFFFSYSRSPNTQNIMKNPCFQGQALKK